MAAGGSITADGLMEFFFSSFFFFLSFPVSLYNICLCERESEIEKEGEVEKLCHMYMNQY